MKTSTRFYETLFLVMCIPIVVLVSLEAVFWKLGFKKTSEFLEKLGNKYDDWKFFRTVAQKGLRK